MLTKKRLAWESETISSERETGDFAASAAVSSASVTEDVFQPFLTKVREGRYGFCFIYFRLVTTDPLLLQV